MVTETRRITRLGKLKCDGTCALTHIITTTDSVKHTFAILDCPGCDGRDWCRKLARLVEKELNLGV